ncbi:MAG: nucleotidyl transferase AbiEii/AbiGii toxin family protein [Chitinispirillaceae bacterium]|nr:nucleotidyl transferase AbiEii/AbiGii toxin family protein [Chitinispirillaceae bacterium]
MNGNNLESLMVLIMNHFADRFSNHAILKGGMELRLLDCPRFTNDLDYVFIPFSSKKDVQDIVVEALKEIPGTAVTSSINSKCLRCVVEHEHMKLQIEINAEKECPSLELSTSALARGRGQQGRIVRVMRPDHALAHKIAAWNERNLMRDMFDMYFLFERCGVKPEVEVLKMRLAASEIRTSGRTKMIGMTLNDLCEKLNSFIESITQDEIDGELKDYLTGEERSGLELKFKAALKKLVEYLKNTLLAPASRS